MLLTFNFYLHLLILIFRLEKVCHVLHRVNFENNISTMSLVFIIIYSFDCNCYFWFIKTWREKKTMWLSESDIFIINLFSRQLCLASQNISTEYPKPNFKTLYHDLQKGQYQSLTDNLFFRNQHTQYFFVFKFNNINCMVYVQPNGGLAVNDDMAMAFLRVLSLHLTGEKPWETSGHLACGVRVKSGLQNMKQ